MYYCVVHFPKINTSKIEEIRSKYDPTIGTIKPHVTLVFPVKTDFVSKEKIIEDIKNVSETTSKFDINLVGFEKSWDNWLFLNVKKGTEEIISLHDKLYTGILEPQWRKDLPFSAHLSLGQFNKKDSDYSLKNLVKAELDVEKYDQALSEATAAKMDYTSTVDKISLITLNDDISEIIETVDFELK